MITPRSKEGLTTRSGFRFSRAAKMGVLLTCIVLALVRCTKPEGPAITLPEKPITVSEQAAINLVNDLSQFQQTAQGSSVSLTDEGLTSLTRLYLDSNYLREPTIWITRQGLVARARLGSRAEYDWRALFTVETESGNPRVAFQRMTLNGRPVPRLVLWSLEEMVNATLTDVDWPAYISQITPGDGVLVIQGTPGTIPAY